MKQGKHYTTVILWILLAAIVAYLGYSIASSLRDPLATTTAIEYEAGAGCYATGYVVRSETLIPSEYDINVLTAAEGARVAAGEPVATGYLSKNARQRQTRIARLTAQVEQLAYADGDASSVADQAETDKLILRDLEEFVTCLHRRDMNSVEDLSSELKGLVLRRSSSEKDAASIRAQRERAKLELEALQTAAEQDTAVIPAPAAGYFSGNVDGYETVLTPQSILNMSVRDYEAIEPGEVPAASAGKLITGSKWYFLTALPADESKNAEKGDRVLVTFARDFYGQIEMRVEYIGKNEAGSRLLVLSSEYYMQNITLLRQQSADIVFVEYSGLRVPKEAVRVNEQGQTGVYILEGINAKWKPITILHDNGESYVVVLDRSRTGNLWPGDEIIVNAKNLYDGKIME